MIIFLLVADAILTIIPIVFTFMYYNTMPDMIPVFVNAVGQPVAVAAKTYATAFRLPVMTLIIQALCLLMYLGGRKSAENNHRTSALLRNFWLAASLTAAMKLSASWVPFTGAVPAAVVPAFRLIGLGAAMLGVLFLLVCLARLYKEEGKELGRIFMPAGRIQQACAGLLVVLYVVVVFMNGSGDVKPPMP